MNNSVWTRAESTLRIVGAGAYVAPHVVTNEQISQAIPGWPADKIEEKTGLVERRYLWPLDVERGKARAESAAPQPTSATDMAEIALSDALAMAGISPRDLDVLVVVTCTPDQPRFSHDAMALHRRIGGRQDAHCFVVDSGCGGSVYVLDMLARMMTAGAHRTAAIVGTNLSSPLLDRDVYTKGGLVGSDGEAVRAYLSAYVFGDGAGAVVLRRDSSANLGIRASMAGNEDCELVRSPGGGTESPPYGDRYDATDHAFVVNGRLVALTYMKMMRESIATVARAADCTLRDVERYYLHQPNDRLLRSFSEKLELRSDQVASNVARIGNTSSAGMFILLAEDLQCGRVALGVGTKVMFAGIGAGVHYGAQLVELLGGDAGFDPARSCCVPLL
jgi:3-oxoacyl-[acyl-carrier-protein] synthase III